MDIKSLVTGLGGTAMVARHMRVGPAAVSNWIAENRVPPARHVEMWRLAVAAGLDWTPPGAEGLVLTSREAA